MDVKRGGVRESILIVLLVMMREILRSGLFLDTGVSKTGITDWVGLNGKLEY